MINNLNNSHLSNAQVLEIQNAITVLENAVSMLKVILTPRERRAYGSVNEKNKLLVNKVWDFRRDSPNLSVLDLDWDEFERDYGSRQLMESILNRFGALQKRIKNTKILHDYDNFQSALEDYAYTSYKAGSQAPGYETKMLELKQFFARSGKGNNPITEGGNP